jgi:hypothetical protein
LLELIFTKSVRYSFQAVDLRNARKQGISTDVTLRTQSPRQGAKPALAGCIFVGGADKSAFALLLTKVTKHIPPLTALRLSIGRNMKIMRFLL